MITDGASACSITEVQSESGCAWPSELAARIGDRSKRRLGDVFGLSQFGVNEVTLAPGARSALRHWHTLEDEFVLILEGQPTLVTDAGARPLGPGMICGFPAGRPDGHCLENRSDAPVRFIEVGTRRAGDCAFYPDDDLMLLETPAGLVPRHKDGRSFDP